MNKQKLLFLTFMQNDRGRSSVGLTLSLVEGSHQQHKDMPRSWGSILQNTSGPQYCRTQCIQLGAPAHLLMEPGWDTLQPG